MSPPFFVSRCPTHHLTPLAVPEVQAERAPRRTARRPSVSQPACTPLLFILGITNLLISFPAVLIAEAEHAPRQGTGHVGEPPDQDSQPARMSLSCLSYESLIHYHFPAVLVVEAQHAPRQATRRSSPSQPDRMSLSLYLSKTAYPSSPSSAIPATQDQHIPRRIQRNSQPSGPVSSGEDLGLDEISSDSGSEPEFPSRVRALRAPSEASRRPTVGSARSSSSVQDVPTQKRKGKKEKKAHDIEHFFDRKSTKGYQICIYCR